MYNLFIRKACVMHRSPFQESNFVQLFTFYVVASWNIQFETIIFVASIFHISLIISKLLFKHKIINIYCCIIQVYFPVYFFFYILHRRYWEIPNIILMIAKGLGEGFFQELITSPQLFGMLIPLCNRGKINNRVAL